MKPICIQNTKLQRRLWKIAQSNNELPKIQCFRNEIGDECFRQVLFCVHKASGDTISHLLSRLNKIEALCSLHIDFKVFKISKLYILHDV